MNVRCWLEPLRRIARAGVDFTYPPVCPLCYQEVGCGSERPVGGFCPKCWNGLTAPRSAACLRCGANIGPNLDPLAGCAFCRDEGYAFDGVYRLGVYDQLLRQACLHAKGRSAEPLAAGLAEVTWFFESAALEAEVIDVVMPIPQHWTHGLFRAHHAADTVAEVFARRLQVPLDSHILRKVRRTLPQASLPPYQRRTNLKKAFAVRDPSSLAGATVLLADDVMTTGATVHEAAKVLRAAGTRRIVVAVLARGLGQRS